MPGPPTDADRAGRLKVLGHCLNIAKSEEDLDVLKNHFPVIRAAVHNVLRLDSQLAGSLADEDQFLANVDRLGVERFCDLVRDAKEENGTWKELRQNGEIPPSPAIALIMTST